MFGYFGDFDSRAKQRQKLKLEIDQLLESESTTVAAIFSLESQDKQDEIMNQLRWGNKKVCQFFNNQRVLELMEYLTQMPPTDSSHDRGHKFPFLANQIFLEGGKGVESIVDQFFYSQKALSKASSSFTDIKRVSNEEQSKDQCNSPVKLTNPFKTLGNEENDVVSKITMPEDEMLARVQDKKMKSPIVEVEDDEINEDEFHDLEFQINEEDDINQTPNDPDQEVNQQGSNPEEQKDAQQPTTASCILQNIQSLVSMLGGSATEDHKQLNQLEEMDTQIKSQENQLTTDINTLIKANNDWMETEPKQTNKDESYWMLDKLANPTNTKKSFEMKLITDDEDDEVFIVHEEGDDQDLLFVDYTYTPNFDSKQVAVSQVQQTSSNMDSIGFTKVENPFKNNLFNSEQMPTMQKLEVEIRDDYIEPAAQRRAVAAAEAEGAVAPEVSTHSENMMKRRKQNKGKKHNISIHQFDEETQKSIQDALEEERNNQISGDQASAAAAVALSKTVQSPQSEPLNGADGASLAPAVTTFKEEFKMVALVEDHISQAAANPKPSDAKREEGEQPGDAVSLQPADEDDNLNDREDRELPPVRTEGLKEPVEVKAVETDDGNLLGGGGRDTLEFQDIEDIQGSKEEQESIELVENTEEIEKKQDYRLLDQLFTFLEPDSAGFDSQGLNLTLSGYFCKVVQVLMQQQPKEMVKYIIHNEYAIFDKLMNHLDNKSICELFIKMLNELSERHQSLPGIPDVQAVLQQSGQSGDGDAQKPSSQKLQHQVDNVKKVQQILIRILDEKLCEESDVLEKMGAFEVLQSLLQKKTFYQGLTSQKSFALMTKRLVSGDEETMRFIYMLLIEMIECYEKHERLEKRINIDNFEDEELINENSGSFQDGKKSRNSKKQNQEVLKDVQESDLYHFFTVVIQEVTAQAIEDRFEQLQAADGDTRIPLGSYFLAMIQFLESASSTFCGFQYDINHMIIEKELFLYLFDIMEYYKLSDFLLKSVFKILDNILRAKNEDIQEMVRYLIEDTPLIPFLINNKPCLIIKEASPTKIKETSFGEAKEHPQEDQKEEQQPAEEGSQTKSPEQSKSKSKSQILQEKSKKEESLQVQQLATTSGLQAYAKGVSGLIHQLYQKDKSQDSKENGGPENSQQSGDRSKSSLVETEEELHSQKVSRIIVQKLKDNEEWRTYATTGIEPILELERGKLGHETDKRSDKDKDDSDGNIFDDDFIRSDFGNGNESSPGPYQNQEPTKLSQEEEEDHQKFVQKIQECFSSKLLSGIGPDKKNAASGDFIDDNERDRKQKQFSALRMGHVDENIRNSLSDLSDDAHFAQRRDRSCSNERFDLPPLPDFDDNKDLTSRNAIDGILTENYQSNEMVKNLKPNEDEDKSEEENKDEDLPRFMLENLSTQTQGPQSMFELQEADDLERDDEKLDQDLFKNFQSYEQDILREMKDALKQEIDDFTSGTLPNYTDADLEAKSKAVGGSQMQDLDEYNSIFDKMDEEDEDLSVIPAFGSELVVSEIMQTLADIQQDFPGVEIKHNNFVLNEPEEQIDQEDTNKQKQIEEDKLDLKPRLLTQSVYVPQQSSGNDLLTLEEKSEYQDNQYWDLKHSQTMNLNLEDLLKEYK